MNKHCLGGGMVALVLSAGTVAALGASSEWTATFYVNKKNLANVGENPYFILTPGYRLQYRGGEATLTITVLPETKTVDGVQTRVVLEQEEENGRPLEVSRNYFAIDKSTGSVYYFGEDVDIYKDGKVVSHEGSWLSGVDGARFGLMMPGKPKVGDKFQQEIAPRKAMDRCEIVAAGETLTTPAGTFKNCLRTEDTSTLEKGVSKKVYAAGVGLVQDDEFVLVKIDKKATGKEKPKAK